MNADSSRASRRSAAVVILVAALGLAAVTAAPYTLAHSFSHKEANNISAPLVLGPDGDKQSFAVCIDDVIQLWTSEHA